MMNIKGFEIKEITDIKLYKKEITDYDIAREELKKKYCKSVSKEEYEDFLKEYSGELFSDYYKVYEPPLLTWSDFTLGVWPDSVVAFTSYCSDDVNDFYYVPPEKREWFIWTNKKAYLEELEKLKEEFKETKIIEEEELIYKLPELKISQITINEGAYNANYRN